MQNAQAIFDILKNIVVAAAAATGAIAGVVGLTAWKRQFAATKNHEVGTKILIALYRFRDALQYVRNPFMWGHEMELDDSERQGKSERQIRYLGRRKAYGERYERVIDTRSQLRGCLVEAEALWGQGIRREFQEVFKFDTELFSQIMLYFDLTDPDEYCAHDEETKKLLKQARGIMYNQSTKTGADDFTQRLEECVGQLERTVRRQIQV